MSENMKTITLDHPADEAYRTELRHHLTTPSGPVRVTAKQGCGALYALQKLATELDMTVVVVDAIPTLLASVAERSGATYWDTVLTGLRDTPSPAILAVTDTHFFDSDDAHRELAEAAKRLNVHRTFLFATTS